MSGDWKGLGGLYVTHTRHYDGWKISAEGHPGFFPFSPKRDTGFKGTLKRAIYDYLGIT